MFINRMLYPPVWILQAVPFVFFIALIIIFALERTESMLAYLLYCTSAYSLVILLADLPKRIRAIGGLPRKQQADEKGVIFPDYWKLYL